MRHHDIQFYVGNCNIYAEQNILAVNHMKEYKIWPRLKGINEKSFKLYCQVLLKV
jgi:hypothetical protein